MTIAGSSCGVRPTAIASANRADWRIERPSAALITKIEPASTAVTVASRREKSCSPCWNAVSPCCSPRRTAIAPNAVREPVRTTTPRPPPPLTSVPMKAHERRSSGESPGGWASAVFVVARDSPVSTDSSHSSSCTSSSRRSAGITSPTRRCTTSPGTSCVTAISAGAPSRSTAARCWISECSSSTAFSERYSLKKLRPTLIAMIAPMINASVRSPTTAETTAATSNSNSR